MNLQCLLIVCVTASVVAGQAPPAPSPTPLFSQTLAQAIANIRPGQETPRERREQAYAKLLEGQRFVWSSSRLRSPAGIASTSQLARRAFQKAVEFDPALAEGYTALAELEISRRTNVGEKEVDEAINLAVIATKIEPDNFGGHRLLARLYSFKSGLKNATLDPAFAAIAVAEWKQVARLDPRNAEAWAFLSEFYAKTDKPDQQIDALRKWLAAASPVDVQFYGLVMGPQASLQPEAASLKLGPALLKAGLTQEAIETLSVVVADDPDNAEAIDLLREGLEAAKGEAAIVAIEALQQAVYAKPSNVSLVTLLAQVQARAGKLDEAAKLLRSSASKLAPTDKGSASALIVSLGELYSGSDRHTDAIEAFEESLVIRGLDKAATVASDDREFAMFVFEKMIQTYKAANRPEDVRAVIDRARQLFGRDDLFSDRQLISFLRETGKKTESLAAIRAVRARYPDDYGFIRLEATLLTETGKVDEAVAIIQKLMDGKSRAMQVAGSPNGKPTLSVPVPAHDEFSNYLFISNLYSQANRGKDAADAANQAYLVARGNERKQIAKLTLATAQQSSGDFKGAETTLRSLLRETPGNPIALNNLGYFLLERDERFDEALDLIQQAVKIDPMNPSYLDSLGWAHFKQGNLAEAEKNLREAARIDTGSSTINEHLGDVYQKQNKPGQARTWWQKALNLASDEADITRLKGKLKL
ncbi:MAG: tetratricopeptide repeat protein [Saprospiraceae bacterium]|nr:tetratricopeptide repeat protein [Pyrinomonadaceae bacterium]